MSGPDNLLDARWFAAHPDRAYHVRSALDWEVAGWPVQPRPGFVCKAVVRRIDRAVFTVAISDPTALDGWSDIDLAGAFDDDLNRVVAS